MSYFWIATFSWPGRGGPSVWSNSGTTYVDGSASRADVLQQVRDVAAEQDGVPGDADVMFFSVEPEMLPGGAR